MNTASVSRSDIKVETRRKATAANPRRDCDGDAENAGLENAGLENVRPNRRGGKGRTGKRGNIMCMGSEM